MIFFDVFLFFVHAELVKAAPSSSADLIQPTEASNQSREIRHQPSNSFYLGLEEDNHLEQKRRGSKIHEVDRPFSFPGCCFIRKSSYFQKVN